MFYTLHMEQKNNTNRILLFFIIFLTSFSLGFYMSSSMNYIEDSQVKIDNVENTGVINSFLQDQLLKKDIDLELFWKVYNTISKNYYSADEIDKKTLEYGLIQWMVSSLWDKFSEFMTPEITKEFEDTLNGDFEGIGAVIDKHELWIMVDMVLKWSPALNNGILKWDIIIEANGQTLKWMSTTDAVNYIKGPAGTQVTLKILRAWENDFITKVITRDKIKIPSVDTLDMKDPEIGYITLNLFWENTSTEFSEMLETFNNEEIKWIIIDLRDNGWGYLQSAVEILSHFIEKNKVLVTTKYKDATLNEAFVSENNGTIFDKKIVILINENSASASEITAWALKDYNKAILVWEKSYGKGSVQQPFSFPDGSMVKLTIAKWYTPKDYSIDHNGINPDVPVSFEKEDYEKKYDRQLEVAKEVLKEYIKLGTPGLVIDTFQEKYWSGSISEDTSSWSQNNEIK